MHHWQSDMQELIRTYMDELKAMIRGLKDGRRPRGAFCKPDCLPFIIVAHFKNFRNVTNEQYRSVVAYLKYLGGTTPRNSANQIIKECFADEVLQNYTFTGWLEKRSFKNTRFSEACIEALSANPNFVLSNDIYADGMTDALKTFKQRLRNRNQYVANIARRRQRHNDNDDEEEDENVQDEDTDENRSLYDEEDKEEF
ncbi:PREDICTED: uncharacterized protein LOC105458667 [Wasmannia auropunctata]|uniref:uncharacterized protein LOC105458667 n=1 Tax=Wasmannia auropunctata TaxID=64793 RepID=UPI0005EDD18C|nr:PREDICTED: uncharacterized protein LOC105458667 [Wasmannia auropunctata]